MYVYISIHATALLNVFCWFILGGRIVVHISPLLHHMLLSFVGKEIMCKIGVYFCVFFSFLAAVPVECQPVIINYLAVVLLLVSQRDFVEGAW